MLGAGSLAAAALQSSVSAMAVARETARAAIL
jgi:hypothetical protein